MGYLNTQLEKIASYAMEKRALSETGLLALLGGGGAAIGALNGEKGNNLASILGGAAGGAASGTYVGLEASSALGDVLASDRFARLLSKHPKLLKLLATKGPYAALAGVTGAGAYAGSALAKKLKKAIFD